MAPFNASPIQFESVSAVTATNSVELGTKRSIGDEEYLYVYNAGNSQISKGVLACLAATGVSGYSVSVSCVSGDFAIGACVHATLTTATYGWLCTRGFVDGMTNGMPSTAIVYGSTLFADVNGAVGLGIGATGKAIGRAVTATGSAGTLSAFISCY